MKCIAITQRVDTLSERNEKRDSLDQRWVKLIKKAGYTPLILPNDIDAMFCLVKNVLIQGVIFSGGNDLVSYGGDAIERDEMEFALLEHVITEKIPTLGVCRGMQLFQHYWSLQLKRLDGHICDKQKIVINGSYEYVNSYHHWGTDENDPVFEVFAQSDDQTIKGIKHKDLPIMGIMWHPERISPFRTEDINLLKRVFN